MNNLIKLQQETSIGCQRLHIDTSTSYRDFIITEYDNKNTETESLHIQLQADEQGLVIGNVQLNVLGIKLLKEFINTLYI